MPSDDIEKLKEIKKQLHVIYSLLPNFKNISLRKKDAKSPFTFIFY